MTISTVRICTFHGRPLSLVEHGAEPFVVMRPLVEAIGLAWTTQHRKLMANDRRWGVINLIIPSAGGTQGMACMPLRKLPAYLCSVEPRKVPAAIRPTIEMFQEECDAALWRYWNDGVARRPDAAVFVPPPPPPPPRPETVEITKDEYIALLKASLAQAVPALAPKRAAARPLDDQEIAEMRRRRKDGEPISHIARAMRRSNATVSFAVRDMISRSGDAAR